MGAAIICKRGMKIDQKMQNPKNERTSLAVFGGGRSMIAWTFFGATLFPFLSHTIPKKRMEVSNRLHFDNLSLRPAFSNLHNSSSMVSKCFSGDLLLIMTSSI